MEYPIRLTPYQEEHKAALLAYQLPEEQLPFTALPETVFERIAARKAQNDFRAVPVSILLREQPVGMFVLDRGADLGLWTDNTQAVFLRSLSINPEFQNQGIGRKAMQALPQFIADQMPALSINEIVLGVNLNNQAAQKLYRRIGFNEYGFNMNAPFVGQIIMKWRLQAH